MKLLMVNAMPSYSRYLFLTGLGLVLFFMITAGILFLNMPIKRVAFFGEFNNIDFNQLQRLTNSWANQPFYRWRAEQLEQQLESLSWLQKAQVSLDHLGEIRIYFDETLPFFRWQSSQVIDAYGHSFAVGPRTYLKYEHLPELTASRENLDLVEPITRYLGQLPSAWQNQLQAIVIQPWRVIEFDFGKLRVITDVIGLEHQFSSLPNYVERLRKDKNQPVLIDLRYNKGVVLSQPKSIRSVVCCKK